MKRIFSLILSLLISAALLSSCSAESAHVRVAALKGPTAMGMVQMMQNDGDYDFTLAASADEVTPLLIRGELDIAAIPANLASILYTNTDGAVRVLAINTLGVLYIVERGDTVHSIEDLRGKTLYTAGKGSTPEYALNFLLSSHGLNPETDLTLEFKSEHAECLAALLQNPDAVAMLPQPFATVAQTKAEDMRIALDLSAEWDALETDSSMITGVVVARTAWLEENPETAARFLSEYEASVRFTQEHPSEAAALIGEFGIFEAAVAEIALPYCNIVYIDGAEMQSSLSGYLSELHRQNPASVGGALPDDNFYFVN